VTAVLSAALLLPVLIGYLIARLFLPVYKPGWTDLVLKLCLGAGMGIGISSGVYFVFLVAIGPSKAYIVAELLLLVAAGAACWARRDGFVFDNQQAMPRGWFWLLLVAFAGALAMAVPAFVDTSSSNPYGGWDAWALWNLRAKFLAQPDASWNNAFSPLLNQLAGGGATHPDYPLLISGFIARCWNLTGTPGDVAAPIATGALFALATVGLAVSALVVLRSWTAGMTGGLVLLGTSAFLLEAPWQYADVPLGFYYLAFFVTFLLSDAEARERPSSLILAGLAMGLAAWTKNEGLMFVLLAAVGCAVYVLRSRKPAPFRTLAPLAAGMAAPLALALWFKFFLAPPTGTYAHLALAAAVRQLVQPSRYLEIAKSVWNESVALGNGGIAHPAISIAVLAGCLGMARDRRRRPAVITAFSILAVVAAAYFFVYVITPLDLTWHLGTSLGRLYVQLWPSFVFLALAALRTAEETAIVLQPAQKATRAPAAKKGRKARAG
jgi:hypothetical protein